MTTGYPNYGIRFVFSDTTQPHEDREIIDIDYEEITETDQHMNHEMYE